VRCSLQWLWIQKFRAEGVILFGVNELTFIADRRHATMRGHDKFDRDNIKERIEPEFRSTDHGTEVIRD
jgi:hypothetical protein